MRKLVIYGAGGFGRETALMIEQINAAKPVWHVTGFYDDGIKSGDVVDGINVVGGLQHVNAITEETDLVIAIADPLTRKKIAESIHNKNIRFPVVVHPQANLGSTINQFARGSIITAGCIFTTGVSVGEFSIVNLLTTIGHDVTIAPYCTIMPGCNISGNVKIGEGTLIGTGSQILQNLSIGRKCKVGAGAVVTKNFEDNLTLIGMPARPRN